MQRVAKVKVTVPKNVQKAITYIREFLAGVATNLAFPLLNKPVTPSSESAKKQRKNKLIKLLKEGNYGPVAAKQFAKFATSGTPPTYTQISDAMDALQDQEDIVQAGATKSDTSLRKDLYNVLSTPVTGLIQLAAAYVQAQSGTDITTMESSQLDVTKSQINPITKLGQPTTPVLYPQIIKQKPTPGQRNTIPAIPSSGVLILKVVGRDPNANSYIYNLVEVDANDQPVEDGESYDKQVKQSKYVFTGLTPNKRYMGTVIANGSRADVVSTESEPAFANCP